MTDLLPPSATAQERALAKVSERIENLPVIYRQLWNADTCPVEFLPYLAWSFSLDQWSDNWPEHIKRQKVKDAIGMHRIKGSRLAVEQAIEQFGVTSVLKEWWEQTPKGEPHTFDVSISAQENERQLPVYEQDGQVQLYGTMPIPVNTARVYRVKIKMRVLEGEEVNTWAGIALLDKGLNDTSGELGYPRRHIAIHDVDYSSGDGWVEAEGEITGVNNSSGYQFTDETHFIVPQCRLNWTGTGISQIAYFEIWDLFENRQLVENPEFAAGIKGWGTTLGGENPPDNAPGTITTAAFRPDADLQDDIIDAITQAKPVRSDFELTVGSVHSAPLELQPQMHIVIHSRETWE